ncbi:SpaH/EbpB family LPXTG-anchored major pilin [Enemella evansiae]|uniref:SpaH/EbpB family LPXTG-anchored major pilin n=1 Tax=Enemella evansiae TaxID=2016499 RepID=UPI000B975DC9|nr:SpaH/EbpB family LPXTG-anchored major pilin [Enemella evansiae]OYO06812.1 hypothetical protein CGZ95_00590 [Enemella evansiae]OYO19748.1 hypothetical protein BI335_04370 [Enemella evansiae]TDO91622.1 LPXTG-motif cell wall-anchored protein [Enemella evansiae]
MNHQTRLAAAVLSAVAVTTFGLSAPMALADPGNPYAVGGVSQENTANKALINPDATVQLSIHKYLGAATGAASNGTQQNVTLPPLAGVNFDVYQVFTDAAHTQPIDLTTNTGWTAAAAINGHVPTPAEIAVGSFTVNGTTYYIAKSATVTTDATGTATFTKPDGVGLYLVNENLSTSGTVTSNGSTIDKGTISPAAAFFVTLPMTNPDDTSRWMYDVNVYPKNQSDSSRKEVTDQGTTTAEGNNAGNHGVKYTITSTITDGMSGAQMGTYVINDQLDPRIGYVGTTVAIDPDGDTGTAALVTLTEGTDYTVATSGTTLVKVTFTSTGLNKLAAANSANPAATVVTTIDGTVNEQGGSGEITNVATVIPNKPWVDANPGNPGIPTNPVESKYGNIEVNKYDPADSNATAAMAGAVFQVFADPTPGDGVCTAGDVSGTPINTATVGSDGKATFTGLQTSDFYNNTAVTDPTKYQSYCLVETKAPAGYNLSSEAVYVTIMSNTATDTTPAVAIQRVANQKANLGNQLPLTGGNGIAALSVGGLLLIGGGLAYYAMTSRKRRQQA